MPLAGRSFQMLLPCLGLAWLGGFNLWAQTEGTITGTITDVSGAVIPNAKVTVTNEGPQGLRVVQLR